MTRPVVCTPLLAEYVALHRAVRRVTPDGSIRVLRTGMGPRRSQASVAGRSAFVSAVLVAGVAGALDPGLRPGEVVVATSVSDEAGRLIHCPTAPLLAALLRQGGLSAHLGSIVCTPRLGGEGTRRALASTGALAVEMESTDLADLATGHPFAVLRVIVDTPDAPLLRLGTIARGVRALRVLHRCAPAIAEWSAVAAAQSAEIPAEHADAWPETAGAATYRDDRAEGIDRAAPRLPAPREVT